MAKKKKKGPKPQKPHPDACEHMPGATVSMEEIKAAAYEKRNNERLKWIGGALDKLAEKLGLEDVKQFPASLLSWIHCNWTDPDMSDVPVENWSKTWIPTIKYVQAYNDYQSVEYRKFDLRTLQCEKDPSGGAGFLLLVKHDNYKFVNQENGKLIRIHVKEDGTPEMLHQLSVNYDEIARVHLRYWYENKVEPMLKFFGEPFKHLTDHQLACIVGDAIQAHPDWFVTIFAAIAGYKTMTAIDGYTHEMHKALEERKKELWGLRHLVNAIQEVPPEKRRERFTIPEYKHGI